jgi:5'-deoxynucleotidase YfbR-like HD superfamily hydrolase
MNIRNVLHSGDVVRFHNHVGIDKQKNSEHEWGCALIVNYIYPQCSKKLLLAALTHDAAEYLTGDIPFPAKQQNPELGVILKEMEEKWEEENGVLFELSKEETIILKIADTLEGMWFCISQVRNGNLNAKRPFRKWRKFFQDNLLGSAWCSPNASNLFELLIKEMEEL